MYLKLIRIVWKESMRSSIWQKNILINIFLGLFIVYFLLILVLVGGALKEIMADGFDVEGIMALEKFGTWVLYFLFFDLFIRFFMQKIPEMAARPYLHLPMKKTGLAGFLLKRTLPSAHNWLPLLLFLPFWGRMWEDFPAFTRFPWLLMLISAVLFNNFLNFYLKRQFAEKTRVVALAGLCILLTGVADYLGWIKLSVLSGWIFNAVLEYPALVVVWIGLPVAMYLGNRKALRNRMYLEDIQPKTKITGEPGRIDYFRRYGKIGELVTLELRLMFRHKRTRSTLYLAPFLLLYGFFFYPNPEFNDKTGWLIFAGLFVTGGFMISYGQFLVAWESTYFDAILTKSINFRDYFRAKYYILLLPTIAAYLLTIPYVAFGWHILIINTAAFLFNAGINVAIYMYFAAYNQKRVELSGGAMFNYQGVGAKQFLIGLPVMVFPVLLYMLVNFFAGFEWGIASVGLAGLTGLIFSRQILAISARHFLSRKYAVADGYRKRY